MIKGIDHIGICVAELDRAISFYRDTIGMQVIGEGAVRGALYEELLALPGVSGRAATLQREGLQIELFEFQVPEPEPVSTTRAFHHRGITHFCIRVEDIDYEYQRLKRAGVPFNSAPTGNEKERAVFGRDPEGNIFELLEIRS